MGRNLKTMVLGFLLLGVAVFVAFWWWWTGRLERSQDKPIRAAAARYHLEPALVKAVIWRESRFDPSARGRHGELGLMQLQEEAAREWADAERLLGGFDHSYCLDPGTNTMAGAFYLAKLLKRYARADDPIPYALADYNAGRRNVLKWLDGAAVTNSAAFIRQMGFPSTQRYVLSVMERYRHYKPRFEREPASEASRNSAATNH